MTKLLVPAAVVAVSASCAGLGEREAERDPPPPPTAATERVGRCPGEWMGTRNAAWIRRAARLVGFQVVDCTGSAWVVEGRTSFYLWATSGRVGSMPVLRRPAPAPLRGDGVRLMWRAQGVSVWLEPGPRADERFPRGGALGRLILATQRLPRRAGPIRMMRTPYYGPLARCRRAPLVGPACPTRIPWIPGWALYEGRGIFGIERSGDILGEPALNRPPAMLHIEIWAGRPGRDPDSTVADWPDGAPIRPRDGLLQQERRRPLLLGAPHWGGRSGSLALIPGYPVGGSMGNHLVFRWREDGYEYLLSLHAWEPFRETVATLRRIVESVPR